MFDEYSAEWLRNLADGGCAACQRPLSADGIAELVHGKPICAQCAARADEYGARREERLMYLEERAARKAQQAHELWERGHEMASVIPFGQPMMPGHHSYARDRRYRARIHRTFERAYEETMAAQRARERAEAAAGNRAIATTVKPPTPAVRADGGRSLFSLPNAHSPKSRYRQVQLLSLP